MKALMLEAVHWRRFNHILIALAMTFIALVTLVPQSSGQTWKKLAPSGEVPPPLRGHQSVFDPNTKQMIVYGIPVNGGKESPLAQVWRLSFLSKEKEITKWEKVQVIPDPVHGAPVGRIGFSAVYDVSNDRMILFGGTADQGGRCLNETWVLVHASGSGGSEKWQKLLTTGAIPTLRRWHSAIYDPLTAQMIVAGGNNCSGTEYTDLWVLREANGLSGEPSWGRLPPIPWRRHLHTAVYDIEENRMIIFGGERVTGTGQIKRIIRDNAIWSLENTSIRNDLPYFWKRDLLNGPLPSGRIGHTSVYDYKSKHMILFGGKHEGIFQNDLWVLSNANGAGTPNWKQIASPGDRPQARSHHTAVYDQTRNRMILFGGESVEGFLNDVWILMGANGLEAAQALHE